MKFFIIICLLINILFSNSFGQAPNNSTFTPPSSVDSTLTPPSSVDSTLTPPSSVDSTLIPPSSADSTLTPPSSAGSTLTPPSSSDSLTPQSFADSTLTPPPVDSTLTPPSADSTLSTSSLSSNDSESPILANKHPILAQPLTKPVIIFLVFLIIFVLLLIACVYITKYKQHWFTKFSPVPTHPRNVDQHNLPIVEKSIRVLEENKNNTNTSFEDNFLDDTRSSTDRRSHNNDETTSLVSNQPSTTSLPQSIDTVK
ncbi:hypothetical protein RclHR1_00090023 [Rhizophagus clarus]|uniref:Thioredoxin domain-containing protein 3 homolog isoform X2 n=1 Tax=Rhizophagus clarus TaxID=94130 RepID=A0A2Z6SPH4_9GLOM|nr:hypothetical protein RclHR1_00090023 [Rhizophagus clarus]GES90499.1 thioredoxin domain-containing protein 3 homolog isoform X2 [Rhizophagus clarus]